MNTKLIPTVNYHLWKACNMRCRFCYATFEDMPFHNLPKDHLSLESSIELITKLRAYGFRKVNFAGGEPTLCPWLPHLVIHSKKIGFETSIITNGYKLLKDPDYLASFNGHLDVIGISIDTLNPQNNINAGRAHLGRYPLTAGDYHMIAGRVRKFGCYLKINTVVARHNHREDLSEFLNQIIPDRWKVLQMLSVEGQNDEAAADFHISATEFEAYCERHNQRLNNKIAVVHESTNSITGSYLMVNPAGCFFDDTKGKHTYSEPILSVGVEMALSQISFDVQKFFNRGGHYEVGRRKGTRRDPLNSRLRIPKSKQSRIHQILKANGQRKRRKAKHNRQSLRRWARQQPA